MEINKIESKIGNNSNNNNQAGRDINNTYNIYVYRDKIKKDENSETSKYTLFEELQVNVIPLLTENKQIFDNYYLNDNKKLWDKFEYKVLENNSKIKNILENNLHLFQDYEDKYYSNLELIKEFLIHIEEFEKTREDSEKFREVLFPKKIYSIFGIAPIKDKIIPSVESLEELIKKLKNEDNFIEINLNNKNPYIKTKKEEIYLTDTPRLRQLFYNYNCFKKTEVRLGSLIHSLKIISSKKLEYKFLEDNNLREILVKGKKIIFVYKYCLSKLDLRAMYPEEESIIVNLHNWNGEGCISEEAYEEANRMNITLLKMEDFYEFIRKL